MASVDKDGRVIIYWQDGHPVYGDKKDEKKKKKKEDDRFAPDIKNPIWKKNDKERYDDKKDKDKSKSTGHALTKLIRGPDGRLRVQYVDSVTGKVLSGRDLDKSKVITAASKLTDIYGRPTGDGDGNKPNTDKVISNVRGHPVDLDTPYPHSKGSTQSSASSTQSISPSTTPSTGNPDSKNPGSQTQTGNPSEQGDMGDGFSRFDPNTSGYDRNPNITQGTETGKEDARPSNLSGMNFTTGNNFSNLEGKDLSKETTASVARNWTNEQVTDAAKTLAGEVDTRISDPNSPEGQKEIGGIMSTIENRALSNYNGDISKAIHAPNQYSAWGDQQKNTTEANYQADPAGWEAKVRAYQADPNSNLGFTHYFNPDIANPGWANDLAKTKIGPHAFMTSKEYTPEQHPLNDEQQVAAATGVVNQAVNQGFATPAGPEIAGSPPDYSTPAINQIANNSWTTPAGQDIASSPPSIGAPNSWDSTPNTVSGFAAGYAAAKTEQQGLAPGRFSSDQEQGGNLASGITAQRDYTGAPTQTQNTDAGRFSNTNEQGGSLSNGYAAQKDFTGAVANNFDNTRFGQNVKTDVAAAATPGYDATTGFATGYQPSISPSPAGVYGSPVGGFTQGSDTDGIGTGIGDTPSSNTATADSNSTAAGTSSTTGENGQASTSTSVGIGTDSSASASHDTTGDGVGTGVSTGGFTGTGTSTTPGVTSTSTTSTSTTSGGLSSGFSGGFSTNGYF